MDREYVLQEIVRRLSQAVILAHHLSMNDSVYESYVAEKLNSFPVLDQHNRQVCNQLIEILHNVYGIDLEVLE